MPARSPTAPTAGAGRIRRLAARLAILALSLLLSLLMLEVGLRLIGYTDRSSRIVDERNEGAYLYDPELNYRFKPDFDGRVRRSEFDTRFSTNSQGFRNDFDFAAADERIVYFLGDSFVAGLGVEADEAVAARVAALLPGRRVYNLGVPGYTTFQHAILLERLGTTYRPELAILFFYMGNDLQEECGLVERRIDERGFRSDRHARGSSARLALRRLALHSRALVFLRARTKALVGRLSSDHSYERSAWLPFYGVGDSAATTPCYNSVGASLKSIRDLGRERGFAVAVVLVAAPEQVSESRVAMLRERFAGFDPYRVNAGMLALCSDLSIPCLDLTQIFADAETQSPVHYPSDGHWNAAGHRLGATAVVEYLEENGFLAAGPRR